MATDTEHNKSFTVNLPAHVYAAMEKAAAYNLYSKATYVRAALLAKLRAEGVKFDDHPTS